jgi:hypothetical protein
MWKGRTKTKKITPNEADGRMLFPVAGSQKKSEVRDLLGEVWDY